MNVRIPPGPVRREMLRRAALATVRFGLRKAGAFLRASAPLVVQAGEKLAALSEHPGLQGPPRSRHHP